jgi:predicted nuclease of predicted toxin-antitoxin system
MKLLFDHNISPRLVQRLADITSEASHVRLHALERASDTDIWTFAKSHYYTIVTKDSDFNDLSVLLSFPPKVIWLRLGNCTTSDIEQSIRDNIKPIEDFLADMTLSILEITR